MLIFSFDAEIRAFDLKYTLTICALRNSRGCVSLYFLAIVTFRAHHFWCDFLVHVYNRPYLYAFVLSYVAFVVVYSVVFRSLLFLFGPLRGGGPAANATLVAANATVNATVDFLPP